MRCNENARGDGKTGEMSEIEKNCPGLNTTEPCFFRSLLQVCRPVQDDGQGGGGRLVYFGVD
jgi:hypothetical protein